MSPSPRNVVEAFFRAYGSRDPTRIARFLAEDVEWRVNGPFELLRFCGAWHGKAAVLELFRELVPEVYAERVMVHEDVLIDGDSAAALSRLTARQRSTGRTISYSAAHFVRFRDGKVVGFRSLIDSLDAAEQLLGHSLDLSPRAGVQRPSDGEVVAV